ncbi:MAG: hypothetical protein IAE90_08355 [Ignavibacteria bacterium]|nr:hypothetical protein [Ignavibacteria bacterium]
MKSPYPSTVFNRPLLNSTFIRRSGLLDKLEKYNETQFIIIEAPPGYGKTTLISSYAESRNAIWLNMTKYNRSPLQFFHSLVAAINNLYPAIGRDLLPLIEELIIGKQQNKELFDALEDTCLLLVNEIESSEGGITVMIDDLQFADRETDADWLGNLLTTLVSLDASKLKLIISSRHKVPVNYPVLEVKNKMVTIGQKDMEFTLEETRELVDSSFPIVNSANFISTYYHELSGWPAGIYLSLQKFKNAESKHADLQELNSYLVSESWNSIDDDLRSFLLKTSIPEDFTIELCNTALELKEPENYIQKTGSLNLYLERSLAVSGEIHYRYTGFFRKFLLEEIKHTFSPAEMSSIRASLAEYYLSKENYADSLLLFSDAGEIGPALKIFKENFEYLFRSYKSEQVVDFADNIPAVLLKEDYELVYFSAKFYLHVQNNAKEAVRILSEYGDVVSQANRVKHTLLLIEAYFVLKEYDLIKGAAGVLEQNISDAEKGALLFVKGRLEFKQGFEHYRLAAVYMEEAISVSKDEEIQNEATRILGHIYHDTGMFIQALFYRKKDAERSSTIMNRLTSLNYLIILQAHLSMFDDAFENLNEMKKLYRTYPLRLYQRKFVKTEAVLYYETGDFETSEAKFNKLIRLEAEAGIVNFKLFNFAMLAFGAYFAGDLNKALNYLELLKQELTSKDVFFTQYPRFFDTMISLKNSGDLSTSNHFDVLESYNELAEKNNMKPALILSYFQTSYCLLKLKEISASVIYLKKALELSEGFKLFTYVEKLFPITRELFDLALSQNISRSFIQSSYSSLISRNNIPWLSDEAKTRLALESRKLTDIRFSPFGKTEFYLRGEKMSEDKWIRKKSKVLLAYLMSDPGRVHTKDMILDMFFDDIPQAKADTMYHSTIYNIRTALKIYAGTGEKAAKSKASDINPQYIVYEDKTLRLNPDFYYVSENDEFEKYCAKVQLTHSSDEEKITNAIKAAELYRGDFMPGYYDGWCEELRVKYKNLFIDICTELVNLLEKHNRPEDVVKYAAMLINEDKLNDAAYIKMIKAYSSIGSKAMAVSCYNTMLKNYEEELGEKPHSKSLAEIKSILDS